MEIHKESHQNPENYTKKFDWHANPDYQYINARSLLVHHYQHIPTNTWPCPQCCQQNLFLAF